MPEHILRNYLETIINNFIDKYLYYDLDLQKVDINTFKNIFIETIKDLVLEEERSIESNSIKLAKVSIDNNINYVVLDNQLNYIKNTLTDILIENSPTINLKKLFNKYSVIESIISKLYLDSYIHKAHSLNIMRINSLNDMVEKQVINYYEDHLIWLERLIESIRFQNSTTLPEIDSSLCGFGKWLSSEAKEVIKNNSKYKNIVKLHDDLHYFGTLIFNQLQKSKQDYHVLMNYLEKCEMLSLSIGTELALIDNTLIIKKAAKDELTSALNRNSLNMIFTNQYELSLATNTPFIVAICDLDNFKDINDTYGHIAGDNLLKDYVSVVKKELRESDIVIRYGGEEFIIILPNTNYEFAEIKLNTIRENFQNHSTAFENREINTTVSMGYIEVLPNATVKHGKIAPEDYINIADKNLYNAKRNGKNRVSHLIDCI